MLLALRAEEKEKCLERSRRATERGGGEGVARGANELLVLITSINTTKETMSSTGTIETHRYLDEHAGTCLQINKDI